MTVLSLFFLFSFQLLTATPVPESREPIVVDTIIKDGKQHDVIVDENNEIVLKVSIPRTIETKKRIRLDTDGMPSLDTFATAQSADLIAQKAHVAVHKTAATWDGIVYKTIDKPVIDLALNIVPPSIAEPATTVAWTRLLLHVAKIQVFNYKVMPQCTAVLQHVLPAVSAMPVGLALKPLKNPLSEKSFTRGEYCDYLSISNLELREVLNNSRQLSILGTIAQTLSHHILTQIASGDSQAILSSEQWKALLNPNNGLYDGLIREGIINTHLNKENFIDSKTDLIKDALAKEQKNLFAKLEFHNPQIQFIEDKSSRLYNLLTLFNVLKPVYSFVEVSTTAPSSVSADYKRAKLAKLTKVLNIKEKLDKYIHEVPQDVTGIHKHLQTIVNWKPVLYGWQAWCSYTQFTQQAARAQRVLAA